MKNIYILILSILMIGQVCLFAQNSIPYQAVLRDVQGLPVANKDISIRFSLHPSHPESMFAYQEEHQTTTNSSGLFTLELGKGTATTNGLESVNWADAPYFAKVEVNSGNGYTIIGVQELLNVPYAKHAEKAGSVRKISNDGTTYQLTVDDLGNLQVIPFPKGYSKLVFQDEFNGEGLADANKWNYERGYIRNPGTEIQYYTGERLKNVFQENGYLTLRCFKNDTVRNGYGDPVNTKETKEGSGIRHYITSGSITTKGKIDWQYCRVEARVKVPMGNDVWPAIWMLPANPLNPGDIWPLSGEIDIMEYWGSNPNKFHYNIHSQKYNHSSPNGGRGIGVLNSNPGDWHVFTLEWHEDRIEWYCDGQLQYRARKNNADYEEWPFDNSFYLLLNFAYENKKLNNLDALPLDYLIDYVRVFK